MLSRDFEFILVTKIWVNRSARQRRAFTTEDIDESIKQRGIINPLIITRAFELKAGERRLSSAIKVGLTEVPCRYIDTLDEIELQIIELEENLKRRDLHWRDEVCAVACIHALYVGKNPEWSQNKTSEALGISKSYITQIIRVNQSLDDPKLAGATGIGSAYNLLTRIDERKIGDAMADIMEVGGLILDKAEQQPAPTVAQQSASTLAPNPSSNIHGGTSSPNVGLTTSILQPKPEPILNVSFLDWAPQYSGPKFNFLHCDFPYGINAFDGSLGAAGANSTSDMDLATTKAQLYSDSPEVYWQLCECLIANIDKIMSPSGHLMFWFSMHYYTETLALFREKCPSLIFNDLPLCWLKSDNRGVISDARRGPRNIVETALFAYREDRPIIRSTSNGYAAPTDKLFHHSAKPEAVLHYFFQMFVDETTRLLDPTCGSGSALRAAERLGARDILGLEIDPEHCSNAQRALRQFRVLRQANKGVSNDKAASSS